MKGIFTGSIAAVIVCSAIAPIITNTYSAAYDFKSNGFSVVMFGTDDAAENSDVIVSATYDPKKESIELIQIPRDTLIETEGRIRKINSITVASPVNNSDRRQRISDAAEFISNNLGVCHDAYLALTPDGFGEVLKAIGDITVVSERKFDLTDVNGDAVLSINKGENRISADDALLLARHRSSYKKGDLARLDVQKMLISGVFKTLYEKADFSVLYAVASVLFRESINDVGFSDVLALIPSIFGGEDIRINCTTLPGEALIYDGTSYYVLNRAGCIDLFRQVKTAVDFDRHCIFAGNVEQTRKIYFNNTSVAK